MTKIDDLPEPELVAASAGDTVLLGEFARFMRERAPQTTFRKPR